MALWYKGFLCHGNPEQFLESLISTVQTERLREYNLPKLIQTAYVEKRSQKQSGEFYLFLGINSPVPGEIPQGVSDILFRFEKLNSPLPKRFYIEADIRPMCTPKDMTGVVAYWKPVILPEADPFEREGDASPSIKVNEARSENYDRLLYWLSAVGSGRWDTLRGACQSLGLEAEGNKAGSIFRRLRLLGHLESAPNGRYWCVAPSVLMRQETPDNIDSYVLCGQRDGTLLEMLRRSGKVQFVSQAYSNAPSSVLVQPEDTDQMRSALIEIGSLQGTVYVTENAGFQLASALPSAGNWQASMEAVANVLPDNFTLKHFNGTDFVEIVFQKQGGLYEFWRKDDWNGTATRPEFALFYDAADTCWRRGDWYGLRFLSRLEANERCPVLYDPHAFSLALPYEWRWPEIYERALTLAAGKLPLLRDGWLVYEGVSPRILQALEDKLCLERGNLNHA